MSMIDQKTLLLICGTLVLSGLLSGGLYTVGGGGGAAGSGIVVNRWTGATWVCYGGGTCFRTRNADQ
jgi:hypothetical protein